MNDQTYVFICIIRVVIEALGLNEAFVNNFRDDGYLWVISNCFINSFVPLDYLLDNMNIVLVVLT